MRIEDAIKQFLGKQMKPEEYILALHKEQITKHNGNTKIEYMPTEQGYTKTIRDLKLTKTRDVSHPHIIHQGEYVMRKTELHFNDFGNLFKKVKETYLVENEGISEMPEGMAKKTIIYDPPGSFFGKKANIENFCSETA
ncbi:hypothetical protein K9L97_05105 [Candidatus Woesearchaeota archaeon]|nr:hypothetical protein [Candidatus Woesearchaeota archaeon]